MLLFNKPTHFYRSLTFLYSSLHFSALIFVIPLFILIVGLTSSFFNFMKYKIQFSCLLSHVRLFVTPWSAECQVLLSITDSQSLLKLMSIKSVMPSNDLNHCRPLLPLPSIFQSFPASGFFFFFFFKWVSSSHQVTKVLEF